MKNKIKKGRTDGLDEIEAFSAQAPFLIVFNHLQKQVELHQYSLLSMDSSFAKQDTRTRIRQKLVRMARTDSISAK